MNDTIDHNSIFMEFQKVLSKYDGDSNYIFAYGENTLVVLKKTDKTECMEYEYRHGCCVVNSVTPVALETLRSVTPVALETLRSVTPVALETLRSVTPVEIYDIHDPHKTLTSTFIYMFLPKGWQLPELCEYKINETTDPYGNIDAYKTFDRDDFIFCPSE